MNYKLIYDQIISKRISNPATGNIERHHIIPKCLGGSNGKSNLVSLSTREHFICHYLLTKIYKHDKCSYNKLLFAFNIMANVSDTNHKRYVNSRLYAALRLDFKRAVSEHMSTRSGRMYICNEELNRNKLVPKEDPIPKGWIQKFNNVKFQYIINETTKQIQRHPLFDPIPTGWVGNYYEKLTKTY